MSARPLASSVAPLALGYDERSTQENMQHVEIPRLGCQVVVTPENSDVPGAAGTASAQQEIHWSAEVASKMAILSVSASSSRRTDAAQPSATCTNR